jgi:energy-converting hydrogenase Eha subunit H
MNKFNVHDVVRALIVVLLSLLSWIGLEIRTEQANIAKRLHAVELNQVKIMAVMGIEPYSSTTEIGPILTDFSH